MTWEQPEAVRLAKLQVMGLAAACAARGWLPATSGNLSVRVAGSADFCVTRSGAHKARLTLEDVLWVDGAGNACEDGGRRPSAETLVHRLLYALLECGAVLHVHTIHNNLAAALHFESGAVAFSGHEMLKALDRWDPRAVVRVPVVENDPDIPRLAEAVERAAGAQAPAVLVRNHGIYTWGAGADDAWRHLEALEFLFEFDERFRSVAGYRFPPSEP